MNKYPAWLNTLVLALLLAGCLFALPNIYGSVEAIQIATNDGEPFAEQKLDEFVRTVENAGVTPEAAYLQDGRVVIRFDKTEDQETASDRLREAYAREANVATTLTPKLPAWLRKLGLKPMSLGLDLRGGVYVLLEVDMDTAIEGRLKGYQQDFEDRLREARIRHRVDLEDQTITVRLTGPEDMQAAREIIREADQEVRGADQVAPGFRHRTEPDDAAQSRQPARRRGAARAARGRRPHRGAVAGRAGPESAQQDPDGDRHARVSPRRHDGRRARLAALRREKR
jgi:hypothetical protein